MCPCDDNPQCGLCVFEEQRSKGNTSHCHDCEILSGYSNMTENDAATLAHLLDRYGYCEVLHTMAVEARSHSMYTAMTELERTAHELKIESDRS